MRNVVVCKLHLNTVRLLAFLVVRVHLIINKSLPNSYWTSDVGLIGTNFLLQCMILWRTTLRTMTKL